MMAAFAPAFGALTPGMNAVGFGVCPGLVCIIASLADDESLPAACVAIMPLAGHVWGGAIHPEAGFGPRERRRMACARVWHPVAALAQPAPAGPGTSPGKKRM